MRKQLYQLDNAAESSSGDIDLTTVMMPIQLDPTQPMKWISPMDIFAADPTGIKTTLGIYDDLSAYAPLDSPALTGIPTAPTAAPGTNTLQLANTAYVTAAVTAAVTGLLELKGSIDASGNPNYPAASKGDSYYITVAGKIGGGAGTPVDVGDVIFALADNAGGTQAAVGASWDILEHNLQGALLAANNLSDLINAGTARNNLGLGTMATQNANAVAITGGTVLGLTGFGVRSTGAAFDMKLANTEVLTADRTLTVKLNDAARTIDIAGALTLAAAFSTAGAFATTLTSTGATNVTLPTTGTLATLAGAEAFSNKTSVGIVSGSLSASAPGLTMTQTWNNAAVAFVGLDMNITDTASQATSILAQLRVGGVIKAQIDKTGNAIFGGYMWSSTVYASNGLVGTPGFAFANDPNNGMFLVTTDTIGHVNGGVEYMRTNATLGKFLDTYNIGWSSAAIAGAVDTGWFRDAAAVIAQRVGVTAQTYRVYRTWTDAANYERLALQTGAGYMEIAAETAGTGTDDIDLRLTPAGAGVVDFRNPAASGAGVLAGTLLNSPVLGNPTYWLKVKRGGTAGYIPIW